MSVGWPRLGPIGAASTRVEESFTLRRWRRRLGHGQPSRRERPPARPVGAKLELTHACNLRCDFCYTDSPRHTVARTADLDEGTWRRVIEETIELGVIEAVVTGGEPLLRASLAIEVVERLAQADIAVTLNTNGWFVNETLADRLAAIRGLTVSISLDGATPELHDAARGVPGSWRRAAAAIGLLLERGVRVAVVHVATPLNARWFPEFLEHAWLLGVRSVRVTPVVPIGAASRHRHWTVDRRSLRRIATAAASRFQGLEVLVQSGSAEVVSERHARAPAAFLVRPAGTVLIDSLHPFAFGHVDEGLAQCWRRIIENWQHPDIARWSAAIRNSRGLTSARLVPYADPEATPGEYSPVTRRHRSAELPALPRRSRSSTTAAATPGDLAASRSHLLQLALARRYTASRIRWSGDPEGERVVRVLDTGHVCRLNGTAALLADLLSEGVTVDEAVESLSRRHSQVDRWQLELDALAGVRQLVGCGILRAASAGI